MRLNASRRVYVTLSQKVAAMKAIVLAVILGLVLVGSFVVLSNVQRQSTDRLAQGDASGFFKQKQEEAAAAKDLAGEASNQPNPVERPTGVSEPLWLDRLQNVMEDCVRAIKSLGHRRQPRFAPPGVYFTLTYLSVRKPSGISGLEPGTQVVCVKDEGLVLLVKAGGNLEFEAKRQFLTNDLDVAALAVRNDAEAQQAVASYIAQQEQAIDHGDDRKIQPSGRH